MGFLDSIFGNSEAASDSRWTQITANEDVDELILASKERPQVVLKHSTRCGTSFFAKKNLDAIPAEQVEGADLYIIDVVRSRSVSLYFGDKVGVLHESPQLFVIRDGAVVWHGSHHQVNEDNLTQALG